MNEWNNICEIVLSYFFFFFWNNTSRSDFITDNLKLKFLRILWYISIKYLHLS